MLKVRNEYLLERLLLISCIVKTLPVCTILQATLILLMLSEDILVVFFFENLEIFVFIFIKKLVYGTKLQFYEYYL